MPSPNIEGIIERQAAFWEMRRRVSEEGGEAAKQALVHLSEGPWITVSKQWGSGGVDLATELARSLGWQVFDREILASIARQTHTRKAILDRLDEHAVGSFNDYLSQLLVPDALSRAGYLQEMMRVVWGLARQGSAVILGRGANWLLKPRFGLRLRVVAPMELRVERVVADSGIDRAEAAKRLRQHDDEQVAFIRQVFDRDINDPLGYDLILNLGAVELATADRIARNALREKLESLA
jgi:cytidylate kinase